MKASSAPLKVLFASVEVAPFAWTGGMGDVAGSLPKALHKLGVDVRVIMPKHRGCAEKAGSTQRIVSTCEVHMPWWVTGCAVDEGRLPGSEVPVYFVEHQQYFDREGVYGPPGASWQDNLERFSFFCRSVVEVLRHVDWQPDLVHLNDWHTSLLALYQRLWGLDFGTVYTAHQLGPAFHGTFPAAQQTLAGIDLGRPETRRFVAHGQIDLARAGLALADRANTVSERYAQEVAAGGSEEGVSDLVGELGDRFCGILNGIDTEVWNPRLDRVIAAQYSEEDLRGKLECRRALQREVGLPVTDSVPLVGMVSRLDQLKGFDLIQAALPQLGGAQFVFLGSGDPGYATFLEGTARYREDVAAVCRFDSDLARKIYAGADILLMPSRREPAGLAQMIALAYGTIPVVHYTGGLADTISEDPRHQNGFVFHEYRPDHLMAALGRAFNAYRDGERWQDLMRHAMRCDHSWGASAAKYREMYLGALQTP